MISQKSLKLGRWQRMKFTCRGAGRK